MRVKICGVPHEVVEVKDEFDSDCHFGQISYAECLIKVNKDMPDEMKQSTVVHEMMHGILNHLGYEACAAYSSGFFIAASAWTAPGDAQSALSSAAQASYSRCIMGNGTKSSASPWMNIVGVFDRVTASIGAASE